MLHTQFHDNRPTGSREEDFEEILPYIGMVAILVMWPGPPWTNFHSPIPWMLHMKFDFNQPSGFREDVWKSKLFNHKRA